jgi:hypothetical protein
MDVNEQYHMPVEDGFGITSPYQVVPEVHQGQNEGHGMDWSDFQQQQHQPQNAYTASGLESPIGLAIRYIKFALLALCLIAVLRCWWCNRRNKKRV